MSDNTSNFFGENRDDEPGITPRIGQLPPQLSHLMVESAAMHSRSQGWLPCVVIRLATEDGAGIVASIVVGEDLDEIIDNLRTAANRSILDVAVGKANGTLP